MAQFKSTELQAQAQLVVLPTLVAEQAALGVETTVLGLRVVRPLPELQPGEALVVLYRPTAPAVAAAVAHLVVMEAAAPSRAEHPPEATPQVEPPIITRL
jgi:hypothetical protein